jgi:hypothetical protein
MRSTLLSLGLAVAALGPAAYVTADSSDRVAVLPPTVYLYSDADLDRLRATNPTHYARAAEIMAAANKLCRPQPPQILLAKDNEKDIACSNMLLRTSNPPKRQISFHLDNTRYIALVTITDNPPQLIPTF